MPTGSIKASCSPDTPAAPSSRPNPFVETTLSYALTYIARAARLQPSHSIKSARLTILADNDYYSQPGSSAPSAAGAAGRFARFPTTLGGAHKTGLGSSAALVTALTATLLSHYLDRTLFDLASEKGRRTLHNLAQTAHCAAQGKVGSGFDVAAAVYGSCTYRRFSPALLSGMPAPGAPGFSTALGELVDSATAWDVETTAGGGGKVSLPPGVAMRMCDVDCGSQTVGMVKQVLAWRQNSPDEAAALWDELQARNGHLAAVLRAGTTDEIPAAIAATRELVRKMGVRSGVPIEPDSQTALLDALSAVDGVFGGVVPGAGGYDAVALLVSDDDQTTSRIAEFVETWSKEKGGTVRLLAVRGEMEGARAEDPAVFTGWL